MIIKRRIARKMQARIAATTCLLIMKSVYGPALYWDTAYAIALALIDTHPEINPESVGLNELATMTEQLPGFVDDPALVNERILQDILINWYEEFNHK